MFISLTKKVRRKIYPTVVIVMRHHQKVTGMEVNLVVCGEVCDSTAYTREEKMTSGMSRMSKRRISSYEEAFNVCNIT